jgi:N-acetylglutamate synthase-like GNAT family acetyltransferase
MTSEFIVRFANMQDSTAVTALLEASYASQLEGGYSQLILAKALPLMTKANPRLLGSDTYYVAQVGTELVGCGGWSKEAPGSGEVKDGIAHIRHVATHPNWLRHGIARSLMVRCFEKAAAAGISSLDCHSTLVAVDFYLATGFHIVGPMEMQLAPDISIDGMLLRRNLSGAQR